MHLLIKKSVGGYDPISFLPDKEGLKFYRVKFWRCILCGKQFVSKFTADRLAKEIWRLRKEQDRPAP